MHRRRRVDPAAIMDVAALTIATALSDARIRYHLAPVIEAWIAEHAA